MEAMQRFVSHYTFRYGFKRTLSPGGGLQVTKALHSSPSFSLSALHCLAWTPSAQICNRRAVNKGKRLKRHELDFARLLRTAKRLSRLF